MNSEIFQYDLDGLRSRIRHCAGLAGSTAELCRRAGIPRRTLENYLTGTNEPKISSLASIANAAKVTLEWLVSGKTPGIDEIARTDLRSEELEKAMQIVERWLEKHNRTMQATRKVRVVLAVHDMLSQDVDEGRRTLDERRIETILRLVV